jgi:hypothetical protein
MSLPPRDTSSAMRDQKAPSSRSTSCMTIRSTISANSTLGYQFPQESAESRTTPKELHC